MTDSGTINPTRIDPTDTQGATSIAQTAPFTAQTLVCLSQATEPRSLESTPLLARAQRGVCTNDLLYQARTTPFEVCHVLDQTIVHGLISS